MHTDSRIRSQMGMLLRSRSAHGREDIHHTSSHLLEALEGVAAAGEVVVQRVPVGRLKEPEQGMMASTTTPRT